jgi:hypothetical protein
MSNQPNSFAVTQSTFEGQEGNRRENKNSNPQLNGAPLTNEVLHHICRGTDLVALVERMRGLFGARILKVTPFSLYSKYCKVMRKESNFSM